LIANSIELTARGVDLKLYLAFRGLEGDAGGRCPDVLAMAMAMLVVMAMVIPVSIVASHVEISGVEVYIHDQHTMSRQRKESKEGERLDRTRDTTEAVRR
jgi:hypothetical protein